MESRPSGMLPLADNVVVWRDRNLRVVDRAGATLWEVDFAKRLVAVDVVGDELVCAAGAIMVFGRQGSAESLTHSCCRAVRMTLQAVAQEGGLDDARHYHRLKGEAAEAVVHELAGKSFLTDWCYPNPRLADGKELCDLLVVFDRVALIWQVKDLKRHADGRYKRGEVEKNLKQLSGAHRRLMDQKRPVVLRNPRRGEEALDPATIDEVFLFGPLR